MKLAWKLFFSYLFVVFVGAGIIVVSTAYGAPVEFSRQVEHMQGMGNQHQRGMGTMLQDLESELNASVTRSVNAALLRSTLIASLAALGVSFFVSQRITRPIRQLSAASQRIAAGHYHETLLHRSDDELGELTHTFNQMASSLAQTEKLRQQLIADVTHELKTPLASITAYMEGLQDGVLQPDDETFGQIHREAHRLQRLVQDLQNLSRAEAGQLQIKLERCDLVEIARSALDWLRPQFQEKNITLIAELPDQPLHFRGDHDRISQVLLNLLSNALHYTPCEGRVTLSLMTDKGHIQFTVQDNGIGLTPEATTLIFQRFYRVDPSRARESGGSGIGLTIARHLVEAHQGKIWAESSGENQGSTFFVELPAT